MSDDEIEDLRAKDRRERIAIAALQGVLSNSDYDLTPIEVAAEALVHADALIKLLDDEV